MYDNWLNDLNYATKALEKIKDNELQKIIKGKIHTIENKDNEILMLLDTKSGIDYIRENDLGMQGIASRVQWGKNWDTFTIRTKRHTGTKTELSKRLEQIKNGYFYPAFTLQAYFDNKQDMNLLSIAITKTLELYEFIEKNKNLIYSNKSDNDFIFVKWSDYEKYYTLKKYTQFKIVK
jgi:hypothetical protein